MKTILLSTAIFLNQMLFGQAFTEIPTPLPFANVSYSSIAFADVDGDQDQDVLITGEDDTGVSIARLYTNDGMGTFTEVLGTPFLGVSYSSTAFADVDGDLDQDVIITGEDDMGTAHVTLFTNNGMGAFTEVRGTRFQDVGAGSIAFADVDGDLDQDVLISGEDDIGKDHTRLYTNNGTGTFREVMGTPFEAVAGGSIAFADVDGDMDQDVLITGVNDTGTRIAKLYTNNGVGTFTEVIGTPFIGVSWSSVAFADIDGDLDLDVLITGMDSRLGGTWTSISKLYTNNGMGVFSEVMGTPFPKVRLSSIAFADVDGDLDQDVLITGEIQGGNSISELYANNGMGGFIKSVGTPFYGVSFGSMAFADVDGDKDQDVLITGEGQQLSKSSKLYINDGMVISIPEIRSEKTAYAYIYPNPSANGKVNIVYNTFLGRNILISLFDINGRSLHNQQNTVAEGMNNIVLDYPPLKQGFYMIQLEDDSQSYYMKLIVR